MKKSKFNLKKPLRALACASIALFSFLGCSTLPNQSSSNQPYLSARYYAYFSNLKETEKKTNKIDKLGSTLFRDWEHPETFSDWRDNGKLGNLSIGYHKPINDKLNWYTSFYAGYGKINNSPHKGLVYLNVDYSYLAISQDIGLEYYPFGRPEFSDSRTLTGKIKSSVKGARPSLSLGIGYSHQETKGDITIKKPGADLKYEEDCYTNLLFTNPLVALEFPITEDMNFSINAGKLYFWDIKDLDKLHEATGPFLGCGLTTKFK